MVGMVTPAAEDDVPATGIIVAGAERLWESKKDLNPTVLIITIWLYLTINCSQKENRQLNVELRMNANLAPTRIEFSEDSLSTIA